MRRKSFTGVGLIFLAMYTTLESPTASACSCAAFPDDVEQAIAIAYARADAIFIGDVTSTNSKSFPLPPMRATTFTVRKVWKGNYDETAVVLSPVAEWACGYRFKRSGTYLVFANWEPRREVLMTNLCELNRSGRSADSFIAALDKLKGR